MIARATVALGSGVVNMAVSGSSLRLAIFGCLEGAVAATTQTSPRNYPGSCSRREPTSPKGDEIRSASLLIFRVSRFSSKIASVPAQNPMYRGRAPQVLRCAQHGSATHRLGPHLALADLRCAFPSAPDRFQASVVRSR